ncbi:O-antigen ligase family protein [Tamlana sp. s12]|uniref:O-antigen ligase family protein n=1 Tax=Tamlana sp. s12 TaxID=1630406 RepID=UPI0007FEC479|nr:O-antigen ligase family protein [Tamlana sp. s12]OBQ54938.1 hypothetical protein VQ01_09330 [Tamlana sp. s12]QQY83045.1 O-antigen ligase family protein [Tamlana sp. s12]
MENSKRKLIWAIFLIASFVTGTIVIYGYSKYTRASSDGFSSIQIFHERSLNLQGLTVYINEENSNKYSYSKPYKFQFINDTVASIEFETLLKFRTLRCYFEYPGEMISVKNLVLTDLKSKYLIELENLNTVGLRRTADKKNFEFEVVKSNGYFNPTKRFIYDSDFRGLYQLLIPILLLISFFTYVIYKINIDGKLFKKVGLPEISLSILILSEFLPAPVYNIALILGVVLNLKTIRLNTIKKNKVNLIFLLFFLIYFFNNLFVTQGGFEDLRTTERFLPFLILSILIPAIAKRKYLMFFPISAIVIGLGLLVTSIFDAFVHGNVVFLSFENFAKYLHPVYYSYLLFFSVIYVQHYYFGRLKYVILTSLIFFLIFSGSKMVLFFSLLVLLTGLINSKKVIIFSLVLISVIFLFSPLKKRFKEVLNQNDLTILNEKHIKNSNDSRINGLTFRLILWREALATMEGTDYIFGKGVTRKTNMILEERLQKLGLLKHQNYNPHNQYVDTFWRTGIVGLLCLILIPLYCLLEGLKRNDRLLILFALFMLAVMSSESIFGRVNGVYFFTTVLLLLMNTKNTDENCHIRN